ncbi:MAG: cation transporter [Hellea sp.]|nr:cation transporter [Hellea sp.]
MGSHHHHDHKHGHGHNCHGNAGQKPIAIAAILTGLFMIVEIWGGLVSGSLALLADAGHMLTDFAALSLAWLAFGLAKRPPTGSLNFGFKRFPVLAAFVNGLTLFLIAGWIVKEAFHRFSHDAHDILTGPMLGVAIAGLLVNMLVFYILRRAGTDSLNVRGAILHVMGDMLGSAAAIVAALVIMKTGYTPIDPMLSILVALLILYSAYHLVRASAHILLQGAPDHLDRAHINDKLRNSFSGIASIENMRIWSLTENETYLSATVTLTESENWSELGPKIQKMLLHDYEISQVNLSLK